jgi:hypothetical protein
MTELMQAYTDTTDFGVVCVLCSGANGQCVCGTVETSIQDFVRGDEGGNRYLLHSSVAASDRELWFRRQYVELRERESVCVCVCVHVCVLTIE